MVSEVPMIALLLFVVLPVVLIVTSFFMRPLVRGGRDPLGAGLVAGGLFGRRPDLGGPEEPVVPEDDEARPFRLS